MKKLICLLLLMILAIGCASIFKKKVTLIHITSEPNSAKVYINGNPMGRTPVTLEVPDKDPVYVMFRKRGYEDISATIGTRVEKRWVFLGILPYFVPAVVDALTGNWNTLNKKEIHRILEPIDAKEQKINNSLPSASVEGEVP